MCVLGLVGSRRGLGPVAKQTVARIMRSQVNQVCLVLEAPARHVEMRSKTVYVYDSSFQRLSAHCPCDNIIHVHVHVGMVYFVSVQACLQMMMDHSRCAMRC